MARKKGVQKGTIVKKVNGIEVKKTKGGSFFIRSNAKDKWQRVTNNQGTLFFKKGGDVETLEKISKALAKGSKIHKKQSEDLEGASKSHIFQSKELDKIVSKLKKSKFAKGGITKGKSHAEGGIPMVVKSTGQMVELEGGEGVINKKNMADTKKHEFEGKMLTKCEIASEINSDGGNGVEIDCDGITGKKYKHEKGGRLEEGGKLKDISFNDFEMQFFEDDKSDTKEFRNSDGSYKSKVDANRDETEDLYFSFIKFAESPKMVYYVNDYDLDDNFNDTIYDTSFRISIYTNS